MKTEAVSVIRMRLTVEDGLVCALAGQRASVTDFHASHLGSINHRKRPCNWKTGIPVRSLIIEIVQGKGGFVAAPVPAREFSLLYQYVVACRSEFCLVLV